MLCFPDWIFPTLFFNSPPSVPLFPPFSSQIYVDQVTEEIVAVTRHSPSTHESVILMAHTAFSQPEPWAIPTEQRPNTHYNHVPPLTIPGLVQEVILEARLVQCTPEAPPFQKHSSTINGLQSHMLDMRTHIPISQSTMCQLTSNGSGGTQEVVFNDFCPGSIIAFR